MTEITAGQIPLWLDMGARIRERVFVGAYFSYGFGILGGQFADACDDASTAAEAQGASFGCSTSDMRLGAQALYHFGAPNEGHAWLGGGIGYSGDGCGADTSNSESIDDRGFHYWLFLGIRGTALP